MELGIFLRVFLVKLRRENALNAEARTQEIKYQHLHVNNLQVLSPRVRPHCTPVWAWTTPCLGHFR